MKILHLAHKPPYPAVDGGCVAIRQMLEGLIENGHRVDLMCLSTYKHPFISSAFPAQKQLQVVHHRVNTRINPLAALWYSLQKKSYNIQRFHNWKARKELMRMLKTESYSAIVLESIFTSGYLPVIRRHHKGPVILRSHNVEHEIWELRAKWEDRRWKKQLLNSLARRMKTQEYKLWDEVDWILSISSVDTAKIEQHSTTPVTTIPMGLKLDDVPERLSSEVRFFHIGSMNWEPNVHGLRWFFDEVWQPFIEGHGQFEFHLAGGHMPKWFEQQQTQNIFSHGFVESASDFIGKYDVMVVPLFEGSGIRIKMLEAMAQGKVVIATPLGAQGIPIIHGENGFIAADERSFLRVMEDLADRPDSLPAIGQRARNTIRDYFSDQIVNREVEQVLQTIAHTNS